MEPKLERTHKPSAGRPADADEAIRKKKEAINRLLDLADARKLNDIYNFILHIL
ncbi:hypothetical protein [Pseudoflavonifractor capillosus]|uniref:Uncharacterized protein n=1 Tax=Pseudoflavonifractor capillosus TaxID=106588 RepID=A0A921ST35_9FIRM|nr:hypothetical protein [Pseudoflavonifractor capillosus]HJG87485.1 hypothetical protein [Pseudoflavonifractor capillosus]